MAPIITSACKCECPPCEQPVELSISQKLDMISVHLESFKGTGFGDHISYLDSARFDDGEQMFPGMAEALRGSPYLETDGQRLEASEALFRMFRSNPQKMANVFQLMGKMPMTVTAQLASLEAGIGDHNRIRLRKSFRNGMGNAEKMDHSATFLLQLVSSLEKGDGVDEPLEITEHDWLLLDRDISARIVHWPVKKWWVDELQVWDVTYPDQLARYVCARIRTHFHNEIKGFGKRCPAHLRPFARKTREVDFEGICKTLGVDPCPDEPLAALE